MKTRTVDLIIAGRKEPGYPQYHFNFSFTTLENLMEKVDEKADELNLRKIDLYIDDDTVRLNPMCPVHKTNLRQVKSQFTDEEYKFMEDEYCIISSGLCS